MKTYTAFMDRETYGLAVVFRAVQASGGPTKLAAAMTLRGAPIRHPAISQWKRIPWDRAKLVAEISGIPIHVLRPDIWDAPPPRERTEPLEAQSA